MRLIAFKNAVRIRMKLSHNIYNILAWSFIKNVYQ